jgi:hypothetical protein
MIDNWHDTPVLRLKIPEDGRRRYTKWVRGIVIHTTKGLHPQKIRSGFGRFTNAGEKVSSWWQRSDRQSGAHLIIDWNGQISCIADLQKEVAYHAGPVNEVTIGIELYQGKGGELYEGQLNTCVRLVDALTRILGIQRQYHTGSTISERMAVGGKNVVGVYGHRNVTTNRGLGDPGNAIFSKLQAAGYEGFDFEENEDKTIWKKRQSKLINDSGVLTHSDGIAGPHTIKMLKDVGYPHGLWVSRPGDDPKKTPTEKLQFEIDGTVLGELKALLVVNGMSIEEFMPRLIAWFNKTGGENWFV